MNCFFVEPLNLMVDVMTIDAYHCPGAYFLRICVLEFVFVAHHVFDSSPV